MAIYIQNNDKQRTVVFSAEELYNMKTYTTEMRHAEEMQIVNEMQKKLKQIT